MANRFEKIYKETNTAIDNTSFLLGCLLFNPCTPLVGGELEQILYKTGIKKMPHWACQMARMEKARLTTQNVRRCLRNSAELLYVSSNGTFRCELEVI